MPATSARSTLRQLRPGSSCNATSARLSLAWARPDSRPGVVAPSSICRRSSRISRTSHSRLSADADPQRLSAASAITICSSNCVPSSSCVSITTLSGRAATRGLLRPSQSARASTSRLCGAIVLSDLTCRGQNSTPQGLSVCADPKTIRLPSPGSTISTDIWKCRIRADRRSNLLMAHLGSIWVFRSYYSDFLDHGFC